MANRGDGGISEPPRPPVFVKHHQAGETPVKEEVPEGRASAAAIVNLTSTAVLSRAAAAAAVGVPLGALITPLPSSDMAPVHVAQRPPVTCSSCGSFMNLYSTYNWNEGWWDCLFCRNRNPASGAMLTEQPQDCPELRSEAVDFHEGRPPGAADAVANVGLTVLAIDATCDTDVFASLRAALLEVVRDLPNETRVALVSFGAALSVWRLNCALLPSSSPPTADVISGASELEDGQLAVLTETLPRYGAHLGTCRQAVIAAIKALRPQWQGQQARMRPRALGAALEAAIAMARDRITGGSSGEAGPSDQLRRKGRVLLIATGPATLAWILSTLEHSVVPSCL